MYYYNFRDIIFIINYNIQILKKPVVTNLQLLLLCKCIT